jgi:hypothetical protein
MDRTNYTWGYATETEFNTYQPDKWKWWIKSDFPAGYYVPNKNWPAMLFTDKAFRNIRTDLASGYTFADDAYSIGNIYNIYFENPEANKTFNRLNCQNFKTLWDNVISPIETEYGEDECNTD